MHPHMKGRCAKQGQKEKQGVNHKEGGHYGDDGEHGDNLLLDALYATVHEANMNDTGQCLNVVGHQVNLKSSPPLKEANIVKPL